MLVNSYIGGDELMVHICDDFDNYTTEYHLTRLVIYRHDISAWMTDNPNKKGSYYTDVKYCPYCGVNVTEESEYANRHAFYDESKGRLIELKGDKAHRISFKDLKEV